MRILLVGLIAAGLAACASETAGPGGSAIDDLTGVLAFVTTVEVQSNSGIPYARNDLHVLQLPRGTPARIYSAAEFVQIWDVTWEPGGDSLAFQTFSGPDNLLHKISAAGGGERVIFDGPGPERYPSYSRDGRLAYFGGSFENANQGIYVDGRLVHGMAWDAFSPPAWSPDGSTLAFLRQSFEPRGLSAVPSNGGSETLLLEPAAGESIVDPAYSPSGARIALSIDGAIWTVAADGSDPRRLTEGPGDTHPSWSPDGSAIAFTRGGAGVYVVDVAGGEITRLVAGPTIRSLAWTY